VWLKRSIVCAETPVALASANTVAAINSLVFFIVSPSQLRHLGRHLACGCWALVASAIFCLKRMIALASRPLRYNVCVIACFVKRNSNAVGTVETDR
jgi:hypothetical protein